MRHIEDPNVPERVRYRFKHYLRMGDFPSALRELRNADVRVNASDLETELDAMKAWLAKRHEFPRPYDTTADEEKAHFKLED